MDPDKIRAVAEWPVPRNVHEVRMFQGLCSYYRRFIEHYSDISKPLTELTKRNEPFQWTQERQVAFDTLKQKLITAPVLSIAKDEGQYVLDVDASDNAVGVVL